MSRPRVRRVKTTRYLRRSIFVLAVLVAVMGVVTVSLLPPRALTSPRASWDDGHLVVRGVYHIHSARSDGTGTIDEIAAAAARAGLQFIILTDHGDGMRAPAPPSYRSGVLCIDGVEISTQHGHYVALGLPQTPYRLGGHPRDVIEDVRRLGGFGIAAHPGSPKKELRWGDWDASFDGLEWLNADSEWRDELWRSLGRVLLTYPHRPTETLATVLDRPDDVLAHWDRLNRQRRVPALAGADAHARLGYREAADPYEDRVIARVPSYDVSFRAFSNHVILDTPFTGDAATDAALLLTALREGRTFTSVDGLAALGGFQAKATSGAHAARLGEYLDFNGPTVIAAQIAGPPETSLIVLRDGKPIFEGQGTVRFEMLNEPGAYRFEARLPAAAKAPSVPWLLTNPIYIGLRGLHALSTSRETPEDISARTPIATEAWRAEASDGSRSALSSGALGDGTPAIIWRFSLAGGTPAGQFAAMRFPLDRGIAEHRRLQLRVTADRPMRIWAQLRVPSPGEGERWGRSFFVDQTLRAVDLRFTEFRPVGPTSSELPALDPVDSLLLVVDTVNTVPGTTGLVAIPDLWLAR